MKVTEGTFAGWRPHRHSWHPTLTRRQFMGTSAGAAAFAVGASLWTPVLAAADDGSDDHDGEGRARVKPRPIPQTVAPGAPFHIQLPGHGNEPSTISDFKGLVGLANVGGNGVGTGPDGEQRDLFFDADVRFMKGTYVGVDHRQHEGTFAFV
jgi:hypothetical protein